MKGLLAVSCTDPDAAVAGDPVVAWPPEPAVRYLGGTEPATIHATADGWVALTPPELDDRVDGHTFAVRLTRAVRSATGDVPVARVADWLADPARPDGAALAGILPPFAAASRARSGGPVVVAGDWVGARQLFWWQGNGVAAVSTSALALAALSGSRLDRDAMAVQSLLGWQIGEDTVFAGVCKLPPGCLAVLDRGCVRISRYVEPLEPSPPPVVPAATTVDEIADLLRSFHEAYLADHAETVLQLSGGLDSRLLLCAVPPGERGGMAAFTLDVRGGTEARVAAELARRCGLSHRVYHLDDQTPLDPAAAFRMACDAAVALDGMASPLALATLLRFEAELDQGHRLAGTAGEVARGFYYPGQPRRAEITPELVRQLARWRLFTNEAVAGEALARELAGGAADVATERLTIRLAGYGPGWLAATDRFYLYDRVQRWAGAHGTVAAVARSSVNPLLDRRFVQLALATTPADRRSSRLVARVVRRLDPELAAVPLDTGSVPSRLAAGGLSARAQRQLATGRKVVAKLRQRVRGERRGQFGVAGLSDLVVEHWRAEPDLLASARSSGLVDEGWLETFLAGSVTAEPATVAFLVNLVVATRAADRDRVGIP